MSENKDKALGTGAREAVDGDLTKSFVPDDVSPSATVIGGNADNVGEQPAPEGAEGADGELAENTEDPAVSNPA